MHRSSEILCNWIVLVCSVSSRQGVSICLRCLGVPRVHQDTQDYKHNLVSKAFSLRKWEGRKGPAIGWSILLCDCRFPTTPSHFLRDKTLGTRLLETDPTAVKPLLSGHLFVND